MTFDQIVKILYERGFIQDIVKSLGLADLTIMNDARSAQTQHHQPHTEDEISFETPPPQVTIVHDDAERIPGVTAPSGGDVHVT